MVNVVSEFGPSQLRDLYGIFATQRQIEEELVNMFGTPLPGGYQLMCKVGKYLKGDSMTESEWLTSDDPVAMLRYVNGDDEPEHLGGRLEVATDRKLRLLAAGCCRLVWDKLTDERSRRAVDVAERYADGLATEEERRAALAEVSGEGYTGALLLGVPGSPERYASLLARDCLGPFDADRVWDSQLAGRLVPSAAQAALLRDVFGNPWRVAQRPYKRCDRCGGELAPLKKDTLPLLSSCRTCSRDGPFWADVVKGDDFPWLTWQGGTVRRLAEAAYTERRRVKCGRCKGKRRVWDDDPQLGIFENYRMDCPDCAGTGTVKDGIIDNERMGVLADALEEAGCEYTNILAHLRSDSIHVRGCWALDLLLGKQ